MLIRIALVCCLVTRVALAQTTDPKQEALLEAARKKFAGKDFPGAKTDITQYLTSNPRNKVAYDLRGQIRMAQEDWYGAISDFSTALELDSTYADALNHRGASKTNLGDDESAIDDLDRGIRASRNLDDPITRKARALRSLLMRKR